MLSNVRLPIDERESVVNVDGYRVHAASETEIPANGIACSNEGVLPASNEILADLTASIPNLTYTSKGEQQRKLKALDALYRRLAGALFMFVTPPITHLHINVTQGSIDARTPLRIETRGGHG